MSITAEPRRPRLCRRTGCQPIRERERHVDQQLVSQISQRAGISPDQATQAIQAVAEFLKGRLPGPMAAQVDSVLGGQAGAPGGMGNMGNLGNMGNMPNQPDQPLGGTYGNQQP